MSANKSEDNQKTQGDIAAKNAFSRWVYKLEGQVIVLEEEIAGGDVQRITRQLETYKSEVQQLHAHADKNDIDISAYDTHFTNIYRHMHSLEGKLKQRTQRQMQFPLYDILRVIGAIASIIVSFFNPLLANAIDKVTFLLPGERGPRTWLLPETAASLQDQPYKPITPLQQPFKLPPSRLQPSLLSQPPAFSSSKFTLLPPAPDRLSLPKTYTLSELRSLLSTSQSPTPSNTAPNPVKPLFNPKPPFINKSLSTASPKFPIKPLSDPKSSSIAKNSSNASSGLPFELKQVLKENNSQNLFTSIIPCITCGAKSTKYVTLTVSNKFMSGYYCIKHFPLDE